MLDELVIVSAAGRTKSEVTRDYGLSRSGGNVVVMGHALGRADSPLCTKPSRPDWMRHVAEPAEAPGRSKKAHHADHPGPMVLTPRSTWHRPHQQGDPSLDPRASISYCAAALLTELLLNNRFRFDEALRGKSEPCSRWSLGGWELGVGTLGVPWTGPHINASLAARIWQVAATDMHTEEQTHTNGHATSSDIAVPVQVRTERPVRPRSAPSRDLAETSPRLTVSIVIPTLDEADNIGPVLRQLESFQDIVLVDGFSGDGTAEIARALRPDITILQREPRGKGDALRAGFAAAAGDIIVIMDADGSMDPHEVDVFLDVIELGFDLVKGSRLACGGGSHDLTTVRMFGNAALCAVANTLFHTHWTDLCYGFLAFRRSCLTRLALTADGFEIEAQILANAAMAGLRIAEVPSVEMPRLAGDSHLNARTDGVRILRSMLAARFAPRARRSAALLRPLPVRGSTALDPRTAESSGGASAPRSR